MKNFNPLSIQSFVLIFITAILASGCAKQEGCTDPLATNFDPDAEEDDQSCVYDNPPGVAGTDTITNHFTQATTLSNIVADPEIADYYFCGNIEVQNEVVVEPGVRIVLCEGSRVNVNTGSLTAEGTASEPIIFQGEAATPGYWDLIHFDSNDPKNSFKNVAISDGGGESTYQHAMVFINNNNNGQASFEEVTFSNSQSYGLYVEGATSTLAGFSSNTFSDNGSYGLRVKANHVAALDVNTNYNDGNAEDYILVDGGSVERASTWVATKTDYLVNDYTEINNDLTVSPGTNIKVGSGVRFDIIDGGSLNAVGTSSEPITFKGEVASTGHWDLLQFDSNNPLNELRHVEISDGGGSSTYQHASIWVNDNNNGSLTIYNTTVSNSYGWGLYAEGGTLLDPATQADILAQNSFSNNGNGSGASCTASCDVYLD